MPASFDRIFFSWAAYNAGPAKVNKMRKIAARKGLNPNQWFFNVESVAAQLIGRETVNYVANINKYYIAYKLQYDMYKRRMSSMENIEVKP